MQEIYEELRLAFLHYLEVYFSHRDFNTTTAMFLPSMTGYGTGFDEKSYSLDEMIELYRRDISEVSEPIVYHIRNLHIHVPTNNTGIVSCELDIRMHILEQEVGLNHLRLSMFWAKHDYMWLISHMHISLPTYVHQDGESYPIKELEERNKVLQRMVEQKTLKLRKALDTISKLATTDKLTGLFNRSKLEESLTNELLRSHRHGNNFSIIFMDIDHFKNVNDRFGHLIGDALLVEFSRIISKRIRDNDIFGRWGGEEFIIICPETSLSETLNLAETIRHTISTHAFKVVGHKTASYGVVSYQKNDTIETLLHRADTALYTAKSKGRNQVFS